ncbi:hypothetical protein CCR85_04910 [Rhodothalassium salexigens]|uniref:TonB-dependent receptor domain-containing protein n=1 Tax=Rhodothalassium salexigens TaxID=1086 RepID=UPI0019148AD5|nr:TonB-dependent receptor [Rhodothalassium salexigens]MBK5910832.1 hypothetical protein [Rhodothalassium salexigens]MBK5921104.1 hypothetical protein [Rhodothalassium salexigens]
MNTHSSRSGLRTWQPQAAIGLCLPLVLAAHPALAQETNASAALVGDQDTASIEEIVVTGSRIPSSNLTLPNPVSSVSSEDIDLSGDVNVIDVINDIPALLSSSNTLQTSGAFGTLGAATANLRSLGTERTLVLVDGRRHVAGVAGSATVDINTIPSALVERVEVLTGGASSIYGADAVTGVVNFILKDDFEGFNADAQFNISDNGDGEIYNVDLLVGGNFADNRGNATFGLTYENQRAVQQGDRFHTRGDRIATDWPNPALRLQQADIDQFGLDQILLGQSIGGFCGAGDGTLGSGQSALCGRIDGAPDRFVGTFPRFGVSNYGGLIGVDFFGSGFLSFFPDPDTIAGLGLDLGADGVVFDVNNNGIEDCFETVNGTLNQRFSGFAGCHVVDSPGGAIRPFQDGLVADGINQFGGDGTNGGRDGNDVIPEQDRIIANASARFDLIDGVTWFGEAKFVYTKAVTSGPGVNGFFDSIPIRYDNPFIPASLRDPIDTLIADNPDVFDAEDVLVFLGRDMTDIGPNRDVAERTTIRVVTGFEGQIPDTSLSYEVSFNYGRTDADTRDGNALIMDRFYAAIDAVTDPATGEVACRSAIETDAEGNPVEPGAAFLPDSGVFKGFNTFDPTDGSCVPMNIFGIGAPSDAAIDFATTTLTRTRALEQVVVMGFVSGDSADLFTLPAGPVGFALGGEYREESSLFDAPAEEERGDTFDPRVTLVDVFGKFDVWEAFGEISAPILRDLPGARSLDINAAVRFADYSTVGSTTTWSAGGTWAPIADLQVRGTYSRAIRAPNINELFSPLTGATARPIDPCDANNLDDGSQFRAQNCAADGIPTSFTDPLTARISGFAGGNPDLREETAKTYTIGAVFQPRFAPGLSATVDFYNIRIEDAIDAPNVQEILNACYDLSTFPNDFCGQIDRDRDPNSPTFLGLQSFQTVELNFVAVETRGIDYAVQYEFGLGDLWDTLAPYGALQLRVAGNYTDKLDRFEDPNDPNEVNEQLFEGRQPRHSFNIDTRWFWRGLTLNLQSRYVGRVVQTTPRVQIETVDNFVNGWATAKWRHDLSATYAINDNLRLAGGINNLADAKPIISDVSFPVGFMGRQFYLGLNFQL